MHFKTPKINLKIQPLERFLEALPRDPIDRPGGEPSNQRGKVTRPADDRDAGTCEVSESDCSYSQFGYNQASRSLMVRDKDRKMATAPRSKSERVDYPTSDGKPMAETELHWQVMVDVVEPARIFRR